MEHLRRKLADEQILLILGNYCDQLICREDLEETLGIGKSQFFVLLAKSRTGPQGFSVSDRPLQSALQS